MRLWTWLVPVLAFTLLLVALAVGVGTLLAVLYSAALVGAVLVAVHHAEVVAHRVGEPLGTLVLRRTLNPVVSPEMKQVGTAEALSGAASNRERRAKTSAALRPGVADGIEQHMMTKN